MSWLHCPTDPSAPVAGSVAASRHPTQWIKLTANLGQVPTHCFYRFDYPTYPSALDFHSALDYRELFAASQVPAFEKLWLIGKTSAGAKKKVEIPISGLGPGTWPVELWGPAPSSRESWPSLWLLDVNNELRFAGWTQWRLAGLVRRRQTTPRYQMPWFAVLFRGTQQYVIQEGVSNPNELYTFREFIQLYERVGALSLPVPREVSERQRFYPAITGLGCWDPMTNEPGGYIPVRQHGNWEFIRNHESIAQDWLARHCITIQGKLYPKTQSFSQPLSSARYLGEDSCTDASVEKIFAWQRGELRYTPTSGLVDPIAALRAGTLQGHAWV